MRSTVAGREDRTPEERPEPPSSPPDLPGSGRRSAYAAVVGLSLVALVALSAIYLFPYPVRHFRYPTGWDAATAVLRAETVAASGIRRFGAIRSGAPLLNAVLMGSTGRSPYTMVAVLPVLLMWMGALGVAALARAALDVRPIWVPVIAFITWAAFGENGMLNLHLDNLLNAALILPAFAAAVSFVRWRRGVVATGILVAAAAVAHWPFYVFAMGILSTALVLFVASSWRRGREEFDSAVRTAVPLAGVVGASAVVAGATFLARSQSGWLGARLVQLKGLLRQRFRASLRQGKTYYPLPTAILGAVAVAPMAPAGRVPRRFFLSLMGAWVLVTVLGGLAQLARIPTAGARELHYFFPLSIFTGLLVWWAARRLSARRTALRTAAAGLVVAVAVGGLAALAVSMRSNDRPWFDGTAVRETSFASEYLGQVGGQEPVVFILEPGTNQGRPAWQVIKTVLPQSLLPRSFVYYGSIQDYLAGVNVKQSGLAEPLPPAAFGAGGTHPTVLVLERYAPNEFRALTSPRPQQVIAPGVAVLRGPVPAQPLRDVRPPFADTRGPHLALTGLGLAMVLLLAGAGWAWALLPADPVVRVALAPGLGAGSTILVALAWAAVRLPLHGGWGSGPLTVAAAGGVAAALALRGRRPRTAGP